ncbi:MAG: allose kinase [Acutalibacteraceae bacterium]
MSILTLGIDIGGTNFRIGTVDENGTIYHFEKNSSSIFTAGNAVEIMAEEIKKYISRYSLDGKISAAGIGIPAIVSRDKRKIISAPNLKGFDGLDFSFVLEKKLGFRIFLDRDVNFLLQNDIDTLSFDKSKTILGFYVGTGLGNSIYLGGGFYTGKNGAAGELGHIPLLGIDEKCSCGNIGCAEVRCSGKHLEELCQKHFPDTPIRKVFAKHPDSPVLLNFVRGLAVPIAAEINILDPDYVVIGGGVIEMEKFPKKLLNESIFEYVRKPLPFNNLEIYFPIHNQQSGILGSAAFAKENL